MEAMPLRTRTIRYGFCVEIEGIDLRTADAEMLRGLAAIQQRHSVVLIRGQAIEPADYVRLGRSVGELMPHTRLEYTLPGMPEIYVLTNKKQDGKPLGVHFDGLGWHSDGTYLRRPLAATLLHALEVPDEGGDTLFADSCRALEDLDAAMRARVAEMRVVYSFTWYMQTRFPDYVVTDRQRRENPDVSHPLVTRRPADGRESLYMSNGSARGIEGMADEAGRDVLRTLTEHVTQDRYVYQHRWQSGDVVIWNNLCTLHSATLYDDTRYERLLHRLWVKAPQEMAWT